MNITEFVLASVTNSASAWEVVGAVEAEVKYLIRESVDSLLGAWEPLDDTPVILKDGTAVDGINRENGEYAVHLILGDGNEANRNISSDNWYTEDLITILEAITTE